MKSLYRISYKGEDYRKRVFRVWADTSEQALAKAREHCEIDHILHVSKRTGFAPILYALLALLAIAAVIGVSALLS